MTDNKAPETRYVQSGELSIAYQVFGQGREDLVVVPGIVSHLEHAWEDPFQAAFRLLLGKAFRVIAFDKRGQGMSDRIDGVPSLDERMDDLRSVMDAGRLSTGEHIGNFRRWSDEFAFRGKFSRKGRAPGALRPWHGLPVHLTIHIDRLSIFTSKISWRSGEKTPWPR